MGDFIFDIVFALHRYMNPSNLDFSTWESTFANPLTIQEELMLNGLLFDLQKKVDTTLNYAMDGEAVVYLPASTKTWVMDMLSLQKRIRMLLDTRGAICLDPCSEN